MTDHQKRILDGLTDRVVLNHFERDAIRAAVARIERLEAAVAAFLTSERGTEDELAALLDLRFVHGAEHRGPERVGKI